VSNRAEIVFGVKLARHLSVYVLGSIAVLVISFVNVYVLTRLLGRAEFGALSLLIFWASLLTLLFNLGSMQGTMRSVFGATGDDDVEDEDEDLDPEQVRAAMGTGLVLTTLICLAGVAIVWPISEPLGEVILGSPERGSWIMLAAATGALGALLRLTSNVLRFERRPIAFVVANAARPLLILGPVIYLVERGEGVGGAIAGTAIGTGLAFIVALALTRGAYTIAFSVETVRTIMRKGRVVIPVVISLWIVQNVDMFVLSRYVPHSDLAPYRVAAQFGLAVTYCTSAFFRAWQPLRRTTASAAVESRFGEDAMRGAMVTYFALMCLTMLIGLTVATETFALVAPRNYTNLPLLIPLVAGGFFTHGALVVIYRAAAFKRKYNYYSAASILSAAGFFGAAVILIPWLGTTGAALAVMCGFLLGMATMLWFSQRREKPIPMQYRNLAGAFAIAALCTAAARAAEVPGGRWQVLIAAAAALAFVALCLVTGVVPRGHQAPLANVLRSLARLRAGHIDPERALAGLEPVDREVLRLAVVHRHTPKQIAEQLGRELDDVHDHLVAALRKLLSESERTEHDPKIGQYLFYRESIAQQDALRKKLWGAGAHPEDVRELEAALEVLDGAPKHAWGH
jgi:O-antigen/teichoic acid export membrane protein/DNA-binding CsgD family transcriptional regulator